MITEQSDLSRTLAPAEHCACLGVGSNVEPASNLRRAVVRLRRTVAVETISTVWQSPAEGAGRA